MPQPSGSLLSQYVALATSLSLTATPLSLTTPPLSLTMKEPLCLPWKVLFWIQSISAALSVVWGPAQVAEPSHTSAWLAHSTSTSTFFGISSGGRGGRAL